MAAKVAVMSTAMHTHDCVVCYEGCGMVACGGMCGVCAIACGGMTV